VLGERARCFVKDGPTCEGIYDIEQHPSSIIHREQLLGFDPRLKRLGKLRLDRSWVKGHD
jgi:hypothetical protein